MFCRNGCNRPDTNHCSENRRTAPVPAAFEEPERDFILRWDGGESSRRPLSTCPTPSTPTTWCAFFGLVGQHFWSDYKYKPAEAGKLLQDDDFIARATLDEIKTLLTYCVRGERFCDGHWDTVLQSGRIGAILRRLAVLKETQRSTPQ